MKILIVEDEPELSESICEYLGREQFICETATDFRTALDKIELYEYACIVLDISLPGGSGLTILKELKANDKADGVLIVSARNSLDDKITGLKSGADDYLTKPFHLAELGARIDAIIRRKSFGGKNSITFGELSINPADKTAFAAGQAIDLTRKEYELLLYLISNKNRVISKNAIANHLWGDELDDGNNQDFIYTHIKNLRRKLARAGCPDYIRSVYGMGYKFSLS
jgi:DNA-binding response OmpR family regulator